MKVVHICNSQENAPISNKICRCVDSLKCLTFCMQICRLQFDIHNASIKITALIKQFKKPMYVLTLFMKKSITKKEVHNFFYFQLIWRPTQPRESDERFSRTVYVIKEPITSNPLHRYWYMFRLNLTLSIIHIMSCAFNICFDSQA